MVEALWLSSWPRPRSGSPVRTQLITWAPTRLRACLAPLTHASYDHAMRVAPALALAALFSCGSSNQVTYEKDVRPVMEARCVSCHSAGGIAPFELTTYEQVAAVKDAVALAVKNRSMPPYLAAPGCTEYADDQNLTDEQIAMLQTFASTGAPRGTVTKPASSNSASLETSLPQVDLTLGMPQAWTPMKDPDDYHCFVIDWPHQTEKYVTDCEADRPVTATAPLRAREPLDAAANVAADMPDPRALDVPADPGSPECSRIASIVIASSIVFFVAVENPMTTP